MNFELFIEHTKLTESAIRTAYILGKAEGNKNALTLEELGQIDMTFIMPYEGENP